MSTGHESRDAVRAGRAVVFLDGVYRDDDGFYEGLAAAADLLIAADGGAGHLARLRVRLPDVILGDLDSLAAERLAEMRAAGVPVIRYPARKDETDAELAARYAVERGMRAADFAGALGGDLGHTLGNLAVLRRLEARGVKARLLEPSLTALVVNAPGALSLSAPPGTRFSLIPLTASAVVTLRRFEYELDAVTLRSDSGRGLGNTIGGPRPEVRLHRGSALLLIAAALQPEGPADRGSGARLSRASRMVC